MIPKSALSAVGALAILLGAPALTRGGPDAPVCDSISSCQSLLLNAIPPDVQGETKEVKKANKKLAQLRKFVERSLARKAAKAELATGTKQQKQYQKLVEKLLPKFIVKAEKFEARGLLASVGLTSIRAATLAYRSQIESKIVEVPTGCIDVKQGEWTFDFSGVLEFVDGKLKQNKCRLSYDRDNIFKGDLQGSTWNVNVGSGLTFSGQFTGSPATGFQGTWSQGGRTGSVTGSYVGG